MDQNFMQYLQGRTQGFQKYAVGNKRYGYGARSAPNIGPTNSPQGYAERDQMATQNRNALLRRLKALQSGRYMSSDYLTPNGGM